MPIESINVSSKIKNYSVYFLDSIEVLLDRINILPNKILIVDKNVFNLYKGLLHKKLNTNHSVILLEVNEDRKTMDSVLELYGEVMKNSPRRNMTIVSIGGGITQDITGYLSSTLYRGVNWIYVPTTLLAQADSCIGSKTSLNYKEYKNLLGTFYPPTEVILCTEFLNTIRDNDFLSGLGEVIKLALLGGGKEYNFIKNNLATLIQRTQSNLLKEAIKQSLIIKKIYIESDELDTGKRNMLNYGHCFGHALEYESNYSIPHGQAVVMGMILANIVARERGLLSQESEQYLKHSLFAKLLPKQLLNYHINFERLVNAMKKDKKRIGEDLPLIMIKEDFEPTKVTDLSIEEVRKAVEEYRY